MTDGSEKEAAGCFGDLQGGSVSVIHSCSHLYQDAIELIARTQASDVPLYHTTIDGTPASATILPLLRLLIKSHLPTTPAKAIRSRTLTGRPSHGIRMKISPSDQFNEAKYPTYTNRRQNSTQDLDHGVTQ